MKLKFILLACGLLLLSLWLAPAKTSAHIVESDGDMTVTLHINPQDYPVINVPQTLEFIYGTPGGKFDARTCTCTMTLLQDNKQLLKKEVPSVNNYFGKLTYTFKKTGVYKVLLSGVPKSSANFSRFNLTFNIRVAKSVPGEASAYSKIPSAPRGNLVKNVLISVGTASLVVSAYVFYTTLKKGSK